MEYQANLRDNEVKDTIRGFIEEKFLAFSGLSSFDDSDSFMEKGIIDSTGVLELLEFIEEKFNIKVEDVFFDEQMILIEHAKGGKSRYVPILSDLAQELKTHLNNRQTGYLFETNRHLPYSTRRVQQIVKRYAEQAGVKCTPHTFRHQAITWLTRHSGLADAELQLITGHARRETLAVYQHVAVDGQLAEKYEAAMREAGL